MSFVNLISRTPVLREGMVHHIVLLQWKEGVSEGQIEVVMDQLTKLVEVIPGLLEMKHGRNHSPENMHHGYEYGFTMLFEDELSRDQYLPHAEHQVCVEVLVPLIKNSIVFDFTAS